MHFILILIIALFVTSHAQANVVNSEEYVFSADRVLYDDTYNITVAVGTVEIIGVAEKIKADSMTFFEETGKLRAEGNVEITDKEGNRFYTDYIELNNDGEDIFSSAVQALLTDDARLKGSNAKRNAQGVVEIEQAYYSPCKACGTDGSKVPWSLNAKKVKHHAEEQFLEYRNAWMEFYGVPILWTPYFTHPDNTVKQESGFVNPTYGFKSDLGWIVGSSYYWGIAPEKDATFGLRATGEQGFVGDIEYRQRFEKGELLLKGSLTQSDRRKDVGGVEVFQEDRVRGHIEGKFDYHLDDKWRLGFDIFRATDDQYARLYDYTNERVFESRAFAERFDYRDYSSFELLYFQDTRSGERAEQPAVLPWIEHDIYTDPNSFLGGRFHLNNTLLSLQRDDGQDVTRASFLGDWERKVLSKFGLSTTVLASTAVDFSYTNDRLGSDTDPAIDSNSFDARIYPQLSLTSSYPVVKSLKKSRLVIEPIVGFVIGTDIDDDDIPNEDSNDFLFDWSSLFSDNRFTGRDRVEGGGRFNYGLRTGLNFDNGSYARIFAGQSYRVIGDDIFPTNAGLGEDASDVVGGIQLGLDKRLILDYNAQFNNDTLSLRRHEIRLSSGWDQFSTNVSYFYDKSAVEGTNLDSVREQLRPTFTWNFAKDWRLRGGGIYDFSPDQDGLIEASTSIGYFNDCFDINLGLERNLIDTTTGDSEFEVMLTLGFKNLGRFEGPSFSQ